MDSFLAYKIAAPSNDVGGRDYRVLVTLRVTYDPHAALYDWYTEECTEKWLNGAIAAQSESFYPSHMSFACNSRSIVVEDIELLDDIGTCTGTHLDAAYSLKSPNFKYTKGHVVKIDGRGASKPFGLPRCVFFYLSRDRALFSRDATVNYNVDGNPLYAANGRLVHVSGARLFDDGQIDVKWQNALTNPRLNPALVDQSPYWTILRKVCFEMRNTPMRNYNLRKRK